MRLNSRWVREGEVIALANHAANFPAIALGNRLLDVEDATMGVYAELSRARASLALHPADGARQSGGWEPPPLRVSWPLAEHPQTDPGLLDKYDRRVHDPVVLEGQRGESFRAAYRLDDPDADIDGAIACLNATPRPWSSASDGEAAPDATIIIPAYGQLGYTLNCLHSLWNHRSQYRYDIMVADDVSPDDSLHRLDEISALRVHRQAVNRGFVRNCNDAAELARGRFIVFLNNDTRVVEGWLDALIDSFASFPRAGLVGSKLFYADGSLQEAGGLIWRDGSCWNYGRNDDPNRPHYAHARQVDYISGCSIAVSKVLWNELGGFDELFVPAYCEDADLALRIKALGQEVWLQPLSCVIHYEGKTNGTDISRGVKSYQVRNNRKLHLRWRARLEAHRPNGDSAYFERERDIRRRALVVDVTMPTPQQDAGSLQTVLALRVLRDQGYKTHFVAQDNFLFHPEYTTALQRIGVECAYAPYDTNFRDYIRLYGPLFDVIMVYRMGVLERVIDDIRLFAPDAALLFHVADLHFLRRSREAERDANAAARAEAEIIKKRELALVAKADCTITHSTVECEILNREVPDAPVTVWPLMVEFQGTQTPFSERAGICFLGGYSHPPNVDAMTYFVAETWPLIQAAEPEMRLFIAGANPTREIAELDGGSVTVLGPVADLRELFDRCRVFICPLRVGAGVKGKIMSALAYGIPVVSTTIGVEGSGLVAGRDVLVAETAQEFVSNTLAVYRDEALWRRLSEAGQDAMRSVFSPDRAGGVLAAAVERALKHRSALDGTVVEWSIEGRTAANEGITPH